MSEEQKLILDMLSEGKITVEEAQTLLESIRQEAPRSETRRDPVQEPKSIIENIVESLRSGLSSLNLNFGDDRRIVLEEHHSDTFSSDMVELDLDVRNGSLRIEPLMTAIFTWK